MNCSLNRWRWAILASVSFAASAARSAEQAPIEIKAGPNAARVVTCAVSFPIDSVQFPEDQVQGCMAAVDPHAVSYIHVIATADSTGSSRHNLYLSTRRAGAIEAFLANRYPSVQVHAFGGGENPKFGKLARIFIVEHRGADESPVQVASIGVPEIIERTKTEVVTRTEYRDRPKVGVTAGTGAGIARVKDDLYRYLGVEARRRVHFAPLPELDLGIRHRVLQSDYAADVQSTSLQVARDFSFGKLLAREVYIDQTLEIGLVHANDGAFEGGATTTAGMRDDDLATGLALSVSNKVLSLGLGLGMRL